jgi:2-isopropylmalate synthase
VLCDTVGHATPQGTRALVQWTKGLINAAGAEVAIDWHGHNDRNLAVVNALAALEAGAQRLHACGLGVGERVGNTSMDLLLLNLKLLGWIDHDLTNLVRYVEKVSEATKVAIPVNYPLSGADAFRTATGVHAAAIIKAKNKGDDWLADRVYSGVPAGEFGRAQVIEIGHMSGMSNVRFWLKQRKLPTTDAVCQRILQAAKSTGWTLTEKEILKLVKPPAVKRQAKAKAVKKTARRARA